MVETAIDATYVESVVKSLYEHPGLRHAVSVSSLDDVMALQGELAAALKRLRGPETVLSRGIKIEVERDDAGNPSRVWLWRALIGGQRPVRDGFSSKADKLGR